jgi:hypothetical protein
LRDAGNEQADIGIDREICGEHLDLNPIPLLDLTLECLETVAVTRHH